MTKTEDIKRLLAQYYDGLTTEEEIGRAHV